MGGKSVDFKYKLGEDKGSDARKNNEEDILLEDGHLTERHSENQPAQDCGLSEPEIT